MTVMLNAMPLKRSHKLPLSYEYYDYVSALIGELGTLYI